MTGMTRWWTLALASSVFVGAAIASRDCVNAQIVPDTSLGAESSVVTPTNTDGLPTDQIDGGAKRGANLFHSFEQFSVPTGGTAYFNNALNIQNIISRVTGGSVSNIDGLIRANGTANLFLLNPNGIIFGSNARLDVGGSFVGSTASSLNFADGTQFSATAPQTTPLLTVSVPLGLQFGSAAGSILNQSQATNSSGELVGLQVQPGKTLALVGGNMSLDGGSLDASGGRVELGGVLGAGTVGLNVNDNDLRLNFPDGVERADVALINSSGVNVTAGGGGSFIMFNGRDSDSITQADLAFINSSGVNVTAGSGGSIVFNARKLEISGGSRLLARIGEGLGSVGSQAGGITLNATGSITIADSFLSTENFGTGDSDGINIKTRSLSLTNGTQMYTRSYAEGRAGNVFIDAQDTVSFANNVFINSETYGSGYGGDIHIKTGSLSLTNNSSLFTSVGTPLDIRDAEGRAGNVFIDAQDTVSFVNGNIFSETYGLRDGGDIHIKTGALSLTDVSKINTSTFAEGNAGNIQINASDSVSVSGSDSYFGGSGLFTTTEREATGQGGDIRVTTSTLRVSDGAILSARTSNASRGGNITVDANTVEITNGGQLLTTAFSQGRAGNITVNATDSVTISGSNPLFANQVAYALLNFRSSTTNSALVGSVDSNGNFIGRLYDDTDRVIFEISSSDPALANWRTLLSQLGILSSLQNDGPASGLLSRVQGDQTANAGDIQVQAGSIRLDNQGTITAKTTLGEGGNITLKAGDILLRHDSNITATAGTASAGGSGGDITIDSGLLTALEDSDITANAFEDKGGNIQINIQGLFLSPDSDITASSEIGVDGVDVDPSQGLVNLPTVPIETEVVQACQPGRSEQQSEFIITGRGGLPPNPTDFLNTDAVWIDLDSTTNIAENRPSSEEATQQTLPIPVQLVEATGWVTNKKGEVVLTANIPTVTPHNPWMPSATCHVPPRTS